MKFQIKHVAVATTLLAGLGASGIAAQPAHAVPAADGTSHVLTAVGSDTTYWAMNSLSQAYNINNTLNTDAPKDRIINVAPLNAAPFPAGDVVPADADCAEVVYEATNPAPNGSGAGVTALNADGTGCIDFARSSSGASGFAFPNMNFFAYALDTVDWVKFPGTHAPANLTQQNIKDIYICDPTTHAPLVTNWNQVGGTAGTIVRYLPQSGSGTRKFFISKILGKSSSFDPAVDCDPQYDPISFQENDATGVVAADKAFAIVPYSYGQWTAQSKAVLPDLRNTSVLASIDGVKPTAATVNETGVTHFLGTRYVYNVLKTTSPRYSDSIRFAGVDNSGPGFLCNNLGNKQITLNGFVPLKKLATGGGVTITSYCRLNPADL